MGPANAATAPLPLCAPSGEGIRHCLAMLAEEAAALHLPATLLAIRAALEACREECGARH